MKKIILFSLIFLLILISVNAIPPQAVLIKEIFFPNASTSSSTFVTIAVATINLTRMSDIDAVVSFQARREGGSGTDNYTWRFLIDDIAGEKNITRSLTTGDVGSVVFSNDRDDLSVGTHNITFQHLSTDGTLFTENIDLVANLHILENNSLVHHIGGDIDSSFSSTSYTETSSGTMNVTETGMIMSVITLQTQSSSVNTIEFILEFNNENTSSFRRRMKTSNDIASIGYIWQFNNVSNGTKNWRLWGRNSETVTTQIIGHVDLDQMINDNIPTTMSHFTNQTTRIDTGDTFFQVANLTIPIVRNNSVHVMATFTANIENQGGVSRNVSYFLQIDDGITSHQMSRTLADVNDIGNLFIQHIFNNSNATHNISLFVASELGGGRILVVNNVSLFAMEVIDFESVIIIPPTTTLNSPSDNTITNITSQTFSCSATDNFGLSNMTFYNNLTGSFIANETKTLSGLSDSETFNLEIAFNNTILWNCESCDNSNNCNFADSNFTLIINQTFPSAVVMSVNLTAPVNNTITFENLITFEFSIDISSNCTLFLNNISINTSNFSSGDNSFIENLSVNIYDWFIRCNDTDSETRKLIIINPPQPPFTFCQNTIPETIIIIFLFLMAFSFMLLPFISKMKEFFIIAGIVDIIVGIAYLFLLCLAMLNWIISLLFIGLGLFYGTLYFVFIFNSRGD